MHEYLNRRYALALYEVAEEKGKIEEYFTDLKSIIDLINNDVEFSKVVKHPQISTTKKKEIFTNVFKGKIDEELLNFLLVLIEKSRIDALEDKLIEMEKIHLERNNTVTAIVKTAVPLLEGERKALIEKLEKGYNKKVILEEQIDKDVLGGVYVRIDDDVIDGTVRSKLQEMRKLILKRE